MAAKQSLIIKTLAPRLSEIGKIKIGRKGAKRTSQGGKEFQAPERLDHFIVTTLQQGTDNNFIEDPEIKSLLCKDGGELKIIPVRLLFDDPELNFQCRYVCRRGQKVWCSGDGETALRMKGNGPEFESMDCLCGRQDPLWDGPPAEACKINSCLSVIIDGVTRVGGVHKFRTTSYNSTVGIMSSLMLIRQLTGGVLAGLPLQLSLNPRTTTIPKTGQPTKIWVVSLEYKGTVEALQQIAYNVAERNALHGVRMREVESRARLMIERDAGKILDVDPEDDALENANTGDVIDIEEVTDKKNTEDQGADATGAPEPPKGRKRLVPWPDADPKLFGPNFASCGATLEQLTTLLKIQNDDPTGGKKKIVEQHMAEILAPTQQRTSYLREDEIQWLINELSVAPEDAAEEDVGIVGNSAVTDGPAGPDERQDEPPAGVGDDDGFPIAE